jgi:hypothetical protein
LKELDSADCGNVATRLAHSTDESATLARLATTIEQVRKLMSEAEIAILSSAEIAFRCHGLEFARARLAHEPGSFVSTSQIVFAVGAQERALNDANLATFAQLVRSIGEVRHPGVRAIIRYGDCIRNAGWSRWSCEALPLWRNAWIQPVCIRKYRRFPRPIAP